jgi:hypothetical protein
MLYEPPSAVQPSTRCVCVHSDGTHSTLLAEDTRLLADMLHTSMHTGHTPHRG